MSAEPVETTATVAAGAEPAACDHLDGCITCGDVALEMRVVTHDPGRGLALCEAADGARETVEVGLVGPVVEGEALLVHAATALARLEGTR